MALGTLALLLLVHSVLLMILYIIKGEFGDGGLWMLFIVVFSHVLWEDTFKLEKGRLEGVVIHDTDI